MQRKLIPSQALLLESRLGSVEGSSRRYGGCTKGSHRSGCFDLPEAGREGPFLSQWCRLSWKAKGFSPGISLFSSCCNSPYRKKCLVQWQRISLHDESGYQGLLSREKLWEKRAWILERRKTVREIMKRLVGRWGGREVITGPMLGPTKEKVEP